MEVQFILRPKSHQEIIRDVHNLSQKEKDKKLLLHLCNKNAVELLLEAGANIDAKNDNGMTALMWASIYGFKDIVELLLLAGADIKTEDNDGWTSSMYASRWGNNNIVKLLYRTKIKNKIVKTIKTIKRNFYTKIHLVSFFYLY